jgi:hypothetical protein
MATKTRRGILRPTDICPFCFERDQLFEGIETGIPGDLVGWGCHRCQIFFLPGEWGNGDDRVAVARYRDQQLHILKR